MEIVEVKRIGHQDYLILNDEVKFSVLIDELKNKLELFKENVISCPDSLIINFKERILLSNELMLFFDVVLNEKVFLIKGIESKKGLKDKIEVIDYPLRAGMVKYFDCNVVVLRNINPGAKLICDYNVYVLGVIKGEVIVKNSKSVIIASGYKNASLQIFDGKKDNVCCELMKFSYINNELVESKLEVEGRELNGESNCCYIG